MPAFSTFASRLLQEVDVVDGIRLACEAGVHGVYLANVLERFDEEQADATVLGFYGEHALLGLAFFGRRGNLVVLERECLDPEQVARAIQAAANPWRIVLGSDAVVGALLALGDFLPIVDRSQIYYGVGPDEVAGDLISDAVRPATRKDLRALMRAALDLNEADLHVDPWRVDKEWLKRNTLQRIQEGTTKIFGERIQSKLDVGSLGPAGMVIEGVYTLPDCRGRGLAARLVATVATEALRNVPLVCLHVAADNVSARRSYEKAGMREVGQCRLLLRG